MDTGKGRNLSPKLAERRKWWREQMKQQKHVEVTDKPGGEQPREHEGP